MLGVSVGAAGGVGEREATTTASDLVGDVDGLGNAVRERDGEGAPVRVEVDVGVGVGVGGAAASVGAAEGVCVCVPATVGKAIRTTLFD